MTEQQFDALVRLARRQAFAPSIQAARLVLYMEVSNTGDLGLQFNCDFDNWDNIDAAINAARKE